MFTNFRQEIRIIHWPLSLLNLACNFSGRHASKNVRHSVRTLLKCSLSVLLSQVVNYVFFMGHAYEA